MPKYRVEFERRQFAYVDIEAADEDEAWDTLVKPAERDWESSIGYEINDILPLEDDDA